MQRQTQRTSWLNWFTLAIILAVLVFFVQPWAKHYWDQREQKQYNDRLMSGAGLDVEKANKWCWEEQKMDHPRIPASACL